MTPSPWKRLKSELAQGLKNLGFKKHKEGDVFLRRIDDGTMGIITFATYRNAVAGHFLCPLIGVINDTADSMRRLVQSTIDYPAWMKNVHELHPTISIELYRLLPPDELDEPFVSGLSIYSIERNHWVFKRDDDFTPALTHLCAMIEQYALPFMESLTDTSKIYDAFVSGRVWRSPIERTSRCEDPFVIFLSGRREQAYDFVADGLERRREEMRKLRETKQEYGDRVGTFVVSPTISNLRDEFDENTLRLFDEYMKK